MPGEPQLRDAICQIGRRLYDRGLAAGTDGNISARLYSGRILISPSGCCLGTMKPDDLVVIDMAGRAASGRRPSSEHWMHCEVYAQRADAMAAIHAHPPTVVAFTIAGASLSQQALPEMILAFGQVPVTRYATPATEEGAEVIRELIQRFDALILDRHGSLTIGKSVADAYCKLDQLEHAARVMLAAHQLGGAKALPPGELIKLARHRERLGLGRADDVAT